MAAIRGGTISANVLYNDSRYLDFRIPNITGALVSYTGQRVVAVSPLTLNGGVSQAFELASGETITPEVRTQYKTIPTCIRFRCRAISRRPIRGPTCR